jgi:hypothetical protein
MTSLLILKTLYKKEKKKKINFLRDVGPRYTFCWVDVYCSSLPIIVHLPTKVLSLFQPLITSLFSLSSVVIVMSDFQIGADLSADQVLQKIRQAGDDATVVRLQLDLGTSTKILLEDERVAGALIEMIVQSWTKQGRQWKTIQLDFTSAGYLEQDSKEEDRWLRLEKKAKEQTSRLGRQLQRRLALDETQIRVDGDVHTEVDVSCDCKYTGVAIISFPKVSCT